MPEVASLAFASTAATIDLASQHQADSDAGSHADDYEISSHPAAPNAQAAASFVHSRSGGVGFDDDRNAVAHLRVVKAQEVCDREISPSQMRRMK
jgi:hypothetical protein